MESTHEQPRISPGKPSWLRDHNHNYQNLPPWLKDHEEIMKLDFVIEFIFMKFSLKQPSSWAKFMKWAAHTHDHEDYQLVILTHAHDHKVPSSWTLLIRMITKVIFVIFKACLFPVLVDWRSAYWETSHNHISLLFVRFLLCWLTV